MAKTTKKTVGRQKSNKSVKKTPKKSTFSNVTSNLFLEKTEYKRVIEGLRAQGLDHDDAVLTLKVGLRQANGQPIPLGLQTELAEHIK